MSSGPMEIKKRVSRRTVKSYSTLFVEARPVVVSVLPGDILEFRELGRRERWHLAIDSAFKYAVRLKANLLLDDERRRKR